MIRTRILLALGLVAATTVQLSCKLNDYCLACEKGDAGVQDGSAGDAGSGDGGNCVPSGPEVCDGKDNDCNGIVDDGTLPQVGDPCGTGMGACAGAVFQCTPMTAGDPTTDMLQCSKKPSPETCDNVDNNCNGMTDEGDPGGGARCGNGTGTCVQGVEHCVGGTIQCVGGTGPTAEVCDGLDNDCDGTIDNGLTSLGSCGAPEPGCASPPCGICQLGTLSCVGGTTVCMGAVNPGFETCNNMDDDCDNSIDEDFNKQTDPSNCGACGNVCGMGLPSGGNATWGCSAGGCVITSCKAGYHDNNNNPADGCEFGPCFTSGAEVCDGQDNDCDGTIDETPAIGTAPAICANKGECAGTVATCPCANKPDSMGCANPDGWTCTYGPTVSTDANGNIVPETRCDGKDNDCNGIIDDAQPQMSHPDGTTLTPVACHDSGIGACQGTGAFQCDASNLNGPAKCVITTPGSSPMPESCNNKDDDCDGVVDNGGSSGSLVGQDWVDIGGGHQMMKYEASKPDSSSADEGTVTTGTTCSKSGVLPWTNVKYSQAVAACAAVGAQLCTESAWHMACSAVPRTQYPVTVDGNGQLIEAEDYFSAATATDATSGTIHAWVEDETPGFFGTSAMAALPDNGDSNSSTNAPAQSPRLDYQINVTATSNNYHVCVHMLSTKNASNTVWVGSSTTVPSTPVTTALTTTSNGSWQWISSVAINIPSMGQRFISLYMDEDGTKVDALYIINGNCPVNVPDSNGTGGKWSFATNPNTYVTTTCNGHDFSAANDDLIATGSATQCFAKFAATGAGPFDMSGNVKEWVLAHRPGENPIRGGSSSDTATGIDCPLDFTLADDTFFFPDVGFRCCR